MSRTQNCGVDGCEGTAQYDVFLYAVNIQRDPPVTWEKDPDCPYLCEAHVVQDTRFGSSAFTNRGLRNVAVIYKPKHAERHPEHPADEGVKLPPGPAAGGGIPQQGPPISVGQAEADIPDVVARKDILESVPGRQRDREKPADVIEPDETSGADVENKVQRQWDVKEGDEHPVDNSEEVVDPIARPDARSQHAPARATTKNPPRKG